MILGQNSDNSDNLLLKEVKKERERHASETTLASSEGSFKENRSENIAKIYHNGNPKSPLSPRPHQNSTTVEKLFSHGHCVWPGCDTALPDTSAFYRHLASQHFLDDKSTAQTRVQMQIVSQLELQLTKEKDRLDGMMKHLQLEQTKNGELKKMEDVKNPNLVHQSHLQMLQSSVDRASETIKHEGTNGKRTPPLNATPVMPNSNDPDLTSRMAAMAAMFPNLPTSLAASLGFPTSQSE